MKELDISPRLELISKECSFEELDINSNLEFNCHLPLVYLRMFKTLYPSLSAMNLKCCLESFNEREFSEFSSVASLAVHLKMRRAFKKIG